MIIHSGAFLINIQPLKLCTVLKLLLIMG